MALSNRLFSDAFRDMQRVLSTFEHPQYPSSDLVETPEAYEVHAELPGYDKKDIKIELSDSHTLVISGNVEKEYKNEDSSNEAATPASKSSGENQVTTTKKDHEKQVGKHSNENRWLVRERTSGSFVRSFALPIAIKPDSIKASYNNGVLKVVVPKAENKQTSQIAID